MLSHAVERVLGTYPIRGEGLAHRVACDLLPHFFVPPKMPVSNKPEEHFNIRRLRLGR
jgi:hypothetical protein